MFERILGIILDPYKVDLCQINRGLNAIEVTHAISQPLPLEIKGDRIKEIGALIRDVCSRNHIRPDVIHSAIPCASSMFRHIHLPFSDMNKIGRVYPYEVEQTLPCSLDDIVMDFHIIQTNRQSGTDILVAILPKKTLEEHIEILKYAGLEPWVTTLEPFGLLFLYQSLLSKKENRVEGIIDLGEKKATIVLVNHDRILSARQMDLDEKEAEISNICDQIGLTLTSFITDSGKPVEKIILTGDNVHISRLETLISERLGIDTEVLSSYKRLPLKLPETGLGRSPFLPAPLGLCLGKRFRKGAAWNFRQGNYSYQKTYTLPRKQVFVLAIFLILLITLGSMNMVARSKFYRNRLLLLEDEAKRTLSHTLPKAKWGPETITWLKKEIEKESKIQEQYAGFFNQGPNTLDLLRELSIRIPKEYDIFIQEILYQQDRVRIKGRVETFEMLDKVKQGLGKSKIFQGIKVEKADIKGQGNQVSFNLLLELK